MRRRDFVALLGTVTTLPIAWLDAARAQQPDRMRHVGVLMAHAESDPEYQDYLTAFRGELHSLGWTEGCNIQIDARWGALEDAESRLRSANESHRAAARRPCYSKHASYRVNVATNAYYPYGFCNCCGSGRQRLRRAWRGRPATQPVS
jgi:hypothetical protein